MAARQRGMSAERPVAYLGRALAPGSPLVWNFLGVLLLINLSNLVVNFREYILKIALTKNIFQPKMHQIAFGGRWGEGGKGKEGEIKEG